MAVRRGAGVGASAAKVARAAAGDTLARLRSLHPDAHCELQFATPFQLLVATVLSAQSTDVAVNKATPGLFARFSDPAQLACADQAEVERLISTIGMFRQKAKNIVGLARLLVERHGGRVPRDLAELVALPGVGRKTANVVLGVAFGSPEGVVVDTHVQRISQRLGWTRKNDPIDIEQDLMKLLPRDTWDIASHTLIFHGRRICAAVKPNCVGCPLAEGVCPSAFRPAVGRKTPPQTPSSGRRTPPRRPAGREAAQGRKR